MLVKIFILTAFLVTAVQTSALADRRDFTIVNHADKTIHYVYCTSNRDPNWSTDLLGSGVVIKPGGSQKLYFHSVTIPDRYWDVRIVFSDGGDWSWRAIDLYDIGRMTIYKNGNSYWADWN